MLRSVVNTSHIGHRFTGLMSAAINTDATRGPFNWIGGRRQEPVDSVGSYDNIEPRTGKVLATIPSSGPKEVERAVQTAKEAFRSWSKVSMNKKNPLHLGVI